MAQALQNLVKRPARELFGKEKEMFDRLEKIANTYKKHEYQKGIEAVEELAEELEQSKTSEPIEKPQELKKEITRQLTRYKMERIDADLKKKDD